MQDQEHTFIDDGRAESKAVALNEEDEAADEEDNKEDSGDDNSEEEDDEDDEEYPEKERELGSS